jgi:hypothetical protein
MQYVRGHWNVYDRYSASTAYILQVCSGYLNSVSTRKQRKYFKLLCAVAFEPFFN